MRWFRYETSIFGIKHRFLVKKNSSILSQFSNRNRPSTPTNSLFALNLRHHDRLNERVGLILYSHFLDLFIHVEPDRLLVNYARKTSPFSKKCSKRFKISKTWQNQGKNRQIKLRFKLLIVCCRNRCTSQNRSFSLINSCTQ